MKNINDDMLNKAAKRVNIDINELKNAQQNGTMNDFIDKKLSPDASKKLKQVLSDKEATQKLLSTPEAKELLNRLMKR